MVASARISRAVGGNDTERASPGAHIFLHMSIEKAQESIGRDAVEPQPNGLTMSPYVRLNLRATESLFRTLKGQGRW